MVILTKLKIYINTLSTMVIQYLSLKKIYLYMLISRHIENILLTRDVTKLITYSSFLINLERKFKDKRYIKFKIKICLDN